MGTKAIFQVKGSSALLGMLTDGTPENLEWVAWAVFHHAEKLGLTDAIRSECAPGAISLVFQAIEKATEGWCFCVPRNDEVANVSYSAYLSPASEKLFLFVGEFERSLKVKSILIAAQKQAQYEKDREEHLHSVAHTD
jgi:hypothetical protein